MTALWARFRLVRDQYHFLTVLIVQKDGLWTSQDKETATCVKKVNTRTKLANTVATTAQEDGLWTSQDKETATSVKKVDTRTKLGNQVAKTAQ